MGKKEDRTVDLNLTEGKSLGKKSEILRIEPCGGTLKSEEPLKKGPLEAGKQDSVGCLLGGQGIKKERLFFSERRRITFFESGEKEYAGENDCRSSYKVDSILIN